MTSFLLLLFCASSAFSELIIAVPASTHAQQQMFDASYINPAPPSSAPVPQIPPQFLQNQGFLQDPTARSQNQAFLQDTTARSQNQAFLQEESVQTPGDSRSFTILQQAQDSLGIGRSDKSGLTITIKLDGSQLARLQGQGSNIENTYAQAPSPAPTPYMQQTSSLAEVLNGGLQILNPFKSTAATAPYQTAPYQTSPYQTVSYQNSITEPPLTESNGFLKSMKNLLKSQFSSYMESSTQKNSVYDKPNYQSNQFINQNQFSNQNQIQNSNQQMPYQSYAIFTPLATQPQKQLGQFRQNVADFLTQNLNFQNPQPKSQLQIAIPQTNAVDYATSATENTNQGESPVYTAASAIVKTVSQIPSNLDLMFNDMGRVYRENLFSLRDKLSDMSSLVPGMISTKINENKDPWLDGYGA